MSRSDMAFQLAADAAMLLASARETAAMGKRPGVRRLHLHGSGLGNGGMPVWQHEMGHAGPVGTGSFAKGDEEAALEAFRNAFTV